MLRTVVHGELHMDHYSSSEVLWVHTLHHSIASRGKSAEFAAAADIAGVAGIEEVADTAAGCVLRIPAVSP